MPVPDRIEVYFSEDEPPIACASVDEVDTVLDDLHGRADPALPLSVTIKVFGDAIDMGLGADPTFLCIQIDPCDGEYYLAVGGLAEGEPVRFYGAGQDSHWDPKNLIPLAVARAAARYFIEHQRRSPNVRWQDWEGRDV